MYCTRYLRLALIAAAASVGVPGLVSSGFAQSVRTFDEAPTIDQLRAIMIPESRPAAVRSVVIQRPGPNTLQTSVQAASPEAVAFHINFAFNSAALPVSAHVMIDRIAQLMKETPQLKLRVEGHTDAAGSASYNISLSEQRALSVTQYLVAQGVAPDRLVRVGKGKAEPLTGDPYDPVNRRVQFVRTG